MSGSTRKKRKGKQEFLAKWGMYSSLIHSVRIDPMCMKQLLLLRSKEVVMERSAKAQNFSAKATAFMSYQNFIELSARQIVPFDGPALARLFESLSKNGDVERFHPHPLTSDEAARLAVHRGRDVYAVISDGDTPDAPLVGYGMLRGWEDGFTIPSLHIVVHPEARGRGVGRAMMHFLHDVARRRGAEAIRLKVYPDNTPARRLYESMGYRFESSGAQGFSAERQIIGLLTLTGALYAA